jgi:hypothetical protein
MSAEPRNSLATTSSALDLSNPIHIRAEMVRQGLIFSHLLPYEDAERGYVDPLNDDETKVAVRRFMGRIWQACLHAERDAQNGRNGTTPNGVEG